MMLFFVSGSGQACTYVLRLPLTRLPRTLSRKKRGAKKNDRRLVVPLSPCERETGRGVAAIPRDAPSRLKIAQFTNTASD